MNAIAGRQRKVFLEAFKTYFCEASENEVLEPFFLQTREEVEEIKQIWDKNYETILEKLKEDLLLNVSVFERLKEIAVLCHNILKKKNNFSEELRFLEERRRRLEEQGC